MSSNVRLPGISKLELAARRVELIGLFWQSSMAGFETKMLTTANVPVNMECTSLIRRGSNLFESFFLGMF